MRPAVACTSTHATIRVLVEVFHEGFQLFAMAGMYRLPMWVLQRLDGRSGHKQIRCIVCLASHGHEA